MNESNWVRKSVLAWVGASLLACSGMAAANDARDPWETYNRSMADFNDAVDRHVIKPVAVRYQKYTPPIVRTGVGNFFANIDDVVIAVNNLLQLKVEDAATDVLRFGSNSVFGVMGLIDVATPLGFAKHNEDFGQTLGYWGVPTGPYLVLPLFGPSTLRDAPSRVVDIYTKPAFHGDPTTRTQLVVLEIVDTRARLLAAERVIEEITIDRYATIRDAYLARREFLVRDGKIDQEGSSLDMLRELEELEALEAMEALEREEAGGAAPAR
ncbi:MAG: VacJ family lipoprotein [Ectothiorhodospiraceae bacterium]|nr:VacJ family lipoprotein [Ectothiorhodospiraceae bacterium]